MWVLSDQPKPIPTGVEEVEEPKMKSEKILKDGLLMIRVGGKTYDVTGRLINQ